jgi:hypothetical protein
VVLADALEDAKMAGSALGQRFDFFRLSAAERLRGADDAPVGRFENDGDVFAFGEFLVEAQRGSCQLAMLAFLKIF